MLVKSLVSVFLAAILTENYVLCKFLGICPFLGVSKKLNTAVGMSVAVTFVMVLATAVTFPIYQYLLVPNDLAYLQTIVFILIIAGLVQLVEIVLKKYIPALYQSLGVYLPLITTNCAILGVTMLVLQKVETTSAFTYTYGHALINSLGAGIGFLVAMVMFAGVRSKIESADIPKFMQGLPITLVAASLVALSFLGFSGFVDKLIPIA
ncbi:MAG: RnfABCDGE type electron transport complex subunit A [Ruminococcus sp.]|nr:RnfABCDGE type electron transport complex subunit A [Ruminococcus sp.]MBQ7134045.1 RnfABCDGE type electron transport complex subunit A [Ruminococcus sp.]